MKKIIALLAAGALLAFVSPMAMAADLKLNGKIDSQIRYNIFNDGTNPATLPDVDKWDGQSNVQLGASLGDGLQAGFSVNNLQRSFVSGWSNILGFTSDPTNPQPILDGSNNITIDKAWIQSKGALWNKGPEFITRLGSQDIMFSPYVARVTDPGVSVQGSFGPISVGAFNAWNNSNPGYGVHASLRPGEGNELNGTYVKVNNQVSYAVDGQMKPTEKLTLNGVYANMKNEGQDAVSAFKIGADYQLAANLGVHAGYRNFEPGFNPIWRDTDMVQDIEGGWAPGVNNPVTDNYAKKGYNVGITAQVAGLNITSDFDLYTQQADDPWQGADQLAGSKHNELNTTVSHDFDLGNNNKLTAGIHEKYDFKSKSQEDLDVTLTYTAPNGLTAAINHDFEKDLTSGMVGLSMSF